MEESGLALASILRFDISGVNFEELFRVSVSVISNVLPSLINGLSEIPILESKSGDLWVERIGAKRWNSMSVQCIEVWKEWTRINRETETKFPSTVGPCSVCIAQFHFELDDTEYVLKWEFRSF